MDTIIISDDEAEADMSVQVIREYKPDVINLDDDFLDPPSPKIIPRSPSPPTILDSSSHPSISQSLISRSPTPKLISPSTSPQSRNSNSQPHHSISRSPTPKLISPSPSPPPRHSNSRSSAAISNSPPLIESSPDLIASSPSHHGSQPASPSKASSSREASPRKASSQQVTSRKEAAKANKVAREELKQQRLKEKEIQRVHKEANRANTASKATQNCIAVVDKKILKIINDEEEAHFTTLFEESSLVYKVTDHPKLDNCVSWTFKRAEVEDGNCVVKTKDTELILVVIDGSEYARKILLYRDNPDDPQSLMQFICDIHREFQSLIVIIVYNLSNYLKTERAKGAKNYQKKFKERFEGSKSNQADDADTETIINIGINDLQDLRLSLLIDLHHSHQDLKVHIEFRDKTQEVVDSIVKYTKAAAGREIKKKERAVTNLDWAINMDKDKAIDPSRSDEDLTKLWIAQLQQFSQITLPIAKTIAAEYPSPSALIDQYESLKPDEAQDLLAELHVQRNLKRQVGQNISRRIYRFLTSEDPDIHIGFD